MLLGFLNGGQRRQGEASLLLLLYTYVTRKQHFSPPCGVCVLWRGTHETRLDTADPREVTAASKRAIFLWRDVALWCDEGQLLLCNFYCQSRSNYSSLRQIL